MLSPLKMIRNFLRLEASAGILLGGAALIALLLNNSPLAYLYEYFLHLPVHVTVGTFSIEKSLLHWINDGLMAIFFLLIGLEIKREVLEGQLSSRDQISLPALAAMGGLIVPALIYIYINWGDEKALEGWAVSSATDIAFALSILMILGSRIPQSLKVCLMAIAILDDLAAIIIIALFYTDNLSLFSLGISSIAFLILFILNIMNVQKIAPYMVVGLFLWACILKSGVHATLAGVALAMFIPLKDSKNENEDPPLHQLENGLHSWIAYGILPLFAFANAGVSLKGVTLDLFLEPITLGIAVGLFLGKQVGVMGFTYLGQHLNICVLPKDVNWTQYYGMALVTGVGFTMSLFIGTLAFDDPGTQTAVRLGVLSGSLVSGVLGYIVLRLSSPQKQTEQH